MLYLAHQDSLKALQSSDMSQGTGFETISQALDPVDASLYSLLGETMDSLERYIRTWPEEFVIFMN